MRRLVNEAGLEDSIDRLFLIVLVGAEEIGDRPAERRRRGRGPCGEVRHPWLFRHLRGLLAAIALVFLVAPTAIVLLTSFTASESLRFPPAGLSLRWYAALLDADLALYDAAGDPIEDANGVRRDLSGDLVACRRAS